MVDFMLHQFYLGLQKWKKKKNKKKPPYKPETLCELAQEKYLKEQAPFTQSRQ